MDLKQAAVYDEYYMGLKLNGWPKIEAAKAARRHVRNMTAKQIDAEVDRILSSKRVA